MKKSYSKYLLGILILTSLIYSNAIKIGFVTNWFGDNYTMEQDFKRDLSGSNLYQLFASTEVVNYHPLTTIYNTIVYKKFVAYKPAVHILNILMHILAVALLYWLLLSLNLSNGSSLIGALIFSLHPINVEAVSWIAELKFGLIAIFYFMSLILYLKYLKSKSILFFVLTLLGFFLGLFIHVSFIFMPMVLLACDYYMSNKISKKMLLEKAPFFLLAIIFAYLVFSVQLISNDFSQAYTFFDRIFIFTYALIFYIYKFLFPFKLLAIYGSPIVVDGFLPIKYYLSFFAVLVVSVLIFRVKKYKKEILFGSLFYLFTIVCFTQLFPVEGPIISERFAYIPFVGLLFIVSFFAGKIQSGEIAISAKLRRSLIGGLFVYLLFFSISSWSRNKVWIDDITLFSDIIKKNPTMASAYWGRANAKSTIGDHKGAIDDYSLALNIEPNVFKSYFNRAIQKTLVEDYNGAISDYTEALKLAPGEHDIFYNRGSIKLILENDSGAIEDFTEALYLSPDFAESYYYRGVAKYNLADDNGAISDYNEAIRIKPDYAEAFYNRGNAKYNLKDNQGAVNDYTDAIKLKPDFAEAYFNRAIQKLIFKDTLAAIKDYSSAISINPQYANAYGARGMLNLRYDKQAAYKDFQKARELGVNASFEMLEEHFNKK